MKVLDCINISKSYNDKEILLNVNFTVEKNDFICLIGKSGVGKSTLLHILGSIIKPSSGKVLYSKETEHPIIVFQQYNKSIYPWLNVFDNLKLVLSSKIQDREVEKKINYYLQLVGLERVKNMFPNELSGGMLQRVAIARSLIIEPKLLLLDEPFGSLDSQIKRGLESDLLKLVEKLDLTIIMVTHDIEEAIFLSNRIFFINEISHSVSTEFNIDLPYPREHLVTNVDSKFIKFKQEILQCFL